MVATSAGPGPVVPSYVAERLVPLGIIPMPVTEGATKEE